MERYARAADLAVALVGADGHLLSRCINPRPTWSLLRAQSPPDANACPFCLMPPQPRRCVTDARWLQQMIRLIDDLLDLSRITRNTLLFRLAA